jgi:Predicted membrane protein (DUF2078).
MSPSPRASGRERPLPGDRDAAGFVVVATVTVLTLAAAFGLAALGFEGFWMAFVLGFGVVLPLSAGAVGTLWPEEEESDRQDRTPLEELKMRYVRGELSEAEFEQQTETLVQTERAQADRRRERP